jgi:DNA-binding transcriptional LysR family regulator
MNYNLNKLWYFLAICRQESITEAAKALNISQPSVTMAVRELEETLGITLFNRYKNRIQLTDEGKMLWAKTNELFQNIDQFFFTLKDMSDRTNVNVKLGIPPIIGSMLIPPIYTAIRETYPEISLQMIECTMKNAIDMLKAHELDLAILIDNHFPKCYNSEVFHKTEIHFCIQKDHPLAQNEYITCTQLANFPLVILSHGSYNYMIIMDFFEREGMTPNIVLQSLEQKTITQLIRHHEMGTFVYKELYMNDPNIVTVPCMPRISANVCIVWNDWNYTTAAAKKVLRHIASKLWIH